MKSFKDVLTEAKGDRIKSRIKKAVDEIVKLTKQIDANENKAVKAINKEFNLKIKGKDDLFSIGEKDPQLFMNVRKFINNNFRDMVELENKRHSLIQSLTSDIYKLPSDNLVVKNMRYNEYIFGNEYDMKQLIKDLDARR
jgi:ABC-type phosphate transport system auxiliary subunit